MAGSTVTAAKGTTYAQILKSSALIGGSSAVTMTVSIVRAKAMALLLGPAGVGLLGLYSSILDLAQSVAGLGVQSSGVRQIAQAASTGDIECVARTAAVLRWTSVVIGVAGAGVLVALSGPIAEWTFGSRRFAIPVALLSLAMIFRAISDGQAALIQGMRRIDDLARMMVVGAVGASSVGIVVAYILREDGVVPMLVSGAAVSLITSWWHRRKIPIPSATLTFSQLRNETAALLMLGVAFMASAVLTTAAAYVIRTLLANTSGIDAAGLYQSAWALGGLYTGFILQAMGSDFYPRLTAVADDHIACNRLVNEQAQVGLLLAGPGVIATLTFAPVVIALFYSTKFAGAVDPLRWICLGMALRVIAWPMGYIVLAKNARTIFFATELAATAVHIGLAYVLMRRFGLTGATMAFFGLYVWHGCLIYAIVRRLTGFRWSAANKRAGSLFMFLISAVFCALELLPRGPATSIGLLAILFSGLYSVRTLCSLVDLGRLPAGMRRALVWSRLMPSCESANP